MIFIAEFREKKSVAYFFRSTAGIASSPHGSWRSSLEIIAWMGYMHIIQKRFNSMMKGCQNTPDVSSVELEENLRTNCRLFLQNMITLQSE